ncbi:MAG: NADH-quinone oxidoreductase subunit NuoE [Gammaproteobacteria bacterium]|nr:NADH-quinone oxidoreductase subunit NuoE [Gammaproteobacteria bacterium]
MLQPNERERIRTAIERYAGDARAASVESLKIVQSQRGWISDEVLDSLADELGLSAVELESIATFYNLIFRYPVGRHVILLCDSVSCWLRGGEQLCVTLRERLGIDLGQTTADGRFTLLPTVCLGACDHAPVMQVDDDLHGCLDPRRLTEPLERYR